MKLSTRSRYGIRMMLDLARHYDCGPVSLHDISRRQEISLKYLEQIAIPLKRASLIKTVRGPKGGQMLARSADQITVGEIIHALEKEFSLAPCVENPDLCDRSAHCLTRQLWKSATEALYAQLNGISLRDMLDQPDVI